jgi:hypothetical protein
MGPRVREDDEERSFPRKRESIPIRMGPRVREDDEERSFPRTWESI